MTSGVVDVDPANAIDHLHEPVEIHYRVVVDRNAN